MIIRPTAYECRVQQCKHQLDQRALRTPVEPVDNAFFLHFHLALQCNLVPVHFVNAAAQLCDSPLQL